ncbi:TetR/AcrR family transcriptional regulator [uncultured Jatrophihabitans sp.]|uniref:TetR/AcrR family transcriptional regulator n=1 Tax=uncultured Jatrophihabitans sp. TaxID=1610747 RepID=UPI0035CA71FC
MNTAEDVGTVSGEDAPRPTRKDAARNRALLIAAAREVFARRGLEASLDDIARQAGVGVGTAYRHFGNKHELAEAIMHETIDEVVAAADRALEADDAWDGLVEFLESVLELQTKDRGLREVLMGVHEAKTDAMQDRLTARVRHLLERAQRDGQARADAESGDVGAMLMMLCHVADLGGDIAPTLWQRYVPTLLSALRPGGPPLPGRALTDAEMHTAIVCQHRMRPPRSTE